MGKNNKNINQLIEAIRDAADVLNLTANISLLFMKEEYMKYAKNNLSASYQRSIKTSFKHIVDFFGEQILIAKIKEKEIDDFLANLKRKVPKGWRVYFRTLKAAFNKAVKWKYLSSNPFSNIRLPREQLNSPDYITVKELELICSNISNPIISNIVRFSFYSGCRLGECVNLRLSNVDFDNKLITIGDSNFNTKTRKQRFIPMNRKLNSILNNIK